MYRHDLYILVHSIYLYFIVKIKVVKFVEWIYGKMVYEYTQYLKCKNRKGVLCVDDFCRNENIYCEFLEKLLFMFL